MLGYFGVFIIHQTLTWTAGSFTRVCDLFSCICMIRTKPKGTSVYSLIRTFVESECDFGEILVWVQSLAVAHSGQASMQ